MMNFFHLLGHELRFHVRQMSAWATLILFFIIIILLLPFAVGPEPDLLSVLAPGFVWLAALLMSLLALEKLFVQDARDGTLDLMLLSPMPLPAIVFAKLLAQSLVMLLVLIIASIPAGLMLGMNAPIYPALLAGLVLGVPILVSLGGIMGSLTVAVNRNAATLTLLLVPFYIPVLIFAVAACDAATLGTGTETPLLMLGAILALLLPTSPFIIAATLRQTQG
jgi:heme exporter protein B